MLFSELAMLREWRSISCVPGGFWLVVCRQLLSSHEIGQLLDEELTEAEKRDLTEAEQICRKFMAWNLDDPGEENSTAGVKKKLAEVLGNSEQDASMDWDSDYRRLPPSTPKFVVFRVSTMVVHVGDELLNYPLAFSYNNTLTSKVQQDSNVLYLVVGPTSINDRVLQARKTTTKTIQGP